MSNEQALSPHDLALQHWQAVADRHKLMIATKPGRADWPATEAVIDALLTFARPSPARDDFEIDTPLSIPLEVARTQPRHPDAARDEVLEEAAQCVEQLEPLITFGPPDGISIISATRANVSEAIRALKSQPPSTVGEDATTSQGDEPWKHTASGAVGVCAEPAPAGPSIFEAWQKLLDGMQRFGMESETIDTLDAYFTDLASPKPTQPSIGMDEREKIAREVLAACPNPWCRDSTPKLSQRGGHLYFVLCTGCGIKCEYEHTEEQAIAAWNARPSPSSEQKEVVAITPIEAARYAVVKKLADKRAASYLIPGYLRGEMDDSEAVQSALSATPVDVGEVVKSAYLEGLGTGPDGGQTDDGGERCWLESDAYAALHDRLTGKDQ